MTDSHVSLCAPKNGHGHINRLLGTLDTITALWTCTKRDGTIVPFTLEKIRHAVSRCFQSEGRGHDPRYTPAMIEKVVRGVVYALGATQDPITGELAADVETIQRYVIQQLFANELFEAAEHYQNYREEHRRRRLTKPVSAEVQATFDRMQQHFPTDLQIYQYMSKFSRWDDAKGRRETWEETVDDRVMPWFKKELRSVGAILTSEEWQEMRDGMYALEALPAMRVTQMAGPALDRCHVGAYNCLGRETQFITRDGVKSFVDFKNGDKTTVLTHTGAWKPARVRNYGKKPLLTNIIRRGRTEIRVRATAEHRWLLRDGSVTTKLQIGDKLVKAPCPAAGWNYDNAEPFEKLAWAYGYVFGDGTRVKKDGEYRYSMVRLCGADAWRFVERFEELGFASSRPLSFGGDVVVYTGTYLKTLPSIDEDIRYLTAFVRGYLDADGQKQTCKTAVNEFGSIQATGETAIAFIRTVFPMVGCYITREEQVPGETNLGTRSAETIRFGLVNNFGEATNSHYGLADRQEEASWSHVEDVWCLEVEDDASFVLPSGIVTGNCAYAPVDDLFAFPEALYILMQGTGHGFSCEADYVAKLPRIQKQRGAKKEIIVVADSTIGWCDAYHRALKLWVDGYDCEFDVSKVRKKGTRLVTKGGRASGPEPFLELMTFARNLFLSRQGRYLEDTDAHRLMCFTGRIVQVGGVRRAAMMSLSDLDSHAMRTIKSGNWTADRTYWVDGKYLSMSNNSAVYDFEGPPPVELFMEEWLSLVKSKSGERGIFNRKAAELHRPTRRKGGQRWGCNPCAEIILRPMGFCNLSIGVSRPHDTVASLLRKVRIAAYFGMAQSLMTKFRYIRPQWAENCKEERLLGVDITGHADCPLLKYGAPGREELQQQLKAEVAKVATMLSARWGINRPAADTTIKPSGDSSIFLDCASGVTGRPAPHIIRWVREEKTSPIARFFVESGVPHADAPEAPDRLFVFGFPKAAPEGSMLQSEMTALQQFDNWLQWKRNYSEHSVSTTIDVEDHEWPALGAKVYENIDEITGCAFLPADHGGYRYAPNQPVTKEEYDKFCSTFPKLNWAKLPHYEETDQTESSMTYACVGGACEMR